MKVSTALALVVTPLAIGIGLVRELAPHYFLIYFPTGVGIFFWFALVEANIPYFMKDPYEPEVFENWTKPGDVIVAVGTKCGTNWLLYCSHQIRTKGLGEEIIDTNIEMPWVELRHRAGQTWEELYDRMNTGILKEGVKLKDRWDHPDYPFRVFKSHATPKVGDKITYPRMLPVRENRKVKYIAMARNGLDVLVSWIKFTGSFNQNLSRAFGIPSFMVRSDLDGALDDFSPDGVQKDTYFGYVMDWWNYRNDENVLLLHYSDMKRDQRGGIRKMAQFLEVDLTEEELDRVNEKCSFTHMKSIQDRFAVRLFGSDDFDTLLCHGADCESQLIRSGKSNQGKTMLSEAQIARWSKYEEETFRDPALLEWARNGGGFL